MSLILDALRKSEAERQRGQQPALHMPASRHRGSRGLGPLAGTVAVVALVGGTAWWMQGTGTRVRADKETADATANGVQPAPSAPSAAAVEQGSLSSAPVLERESAPMRAGDVSALGNAPVMAQGSAGTGGGEWPDPMLNPGASANAQPFVQMPPAVTAPAPQPEPPVPAADPGSAVIDQAAVDAAAAQQLQVQAAQQVNGLESAAGTAAASAAVPLPPADFVPETAIPGVPSIFDLEFLVRRELPKMALSMHVYAADPSRRFALINGKRYVPGGEAIDGKVLVIDVVPEGVICEINGTRFLLPRQ